MNRGIIAAPGSVTLSGTSFTVQPTLTPDDIRFYLFYWQKVIIPTSNFIHLGIPDEDVLVETGAIWRPRVIHRGVVSGEDILRGQTELANEMVKDKNTDWTILQPGNQIYLPNDVVTTRSAIRITLAKALPVPPSDVHIADVLDFKERRSDELSALHSTLDQLYFDVLNSPDPDLSSKLAFSNLNEEIENLNRVFSEKYNISRKFDLSAEFAFSGKEALQALAGAAVAESYFSGLSFPLTTAVAAAASSLKVSCKASMTFTASQSIKKFGYLARASREGLLT